MNHMKKHLKVTATIGLVSIAMFALAQVRVVGGGHISGPANHGGGQAFASIADGPPQNAAIAALRSHLSARLNLMRLEAKAQGQNDVAYQYIEVNCWAVLAGMTPSQQRYEIDNVWQLSKFKPNSNWDRIAAAPSMVSELLKVSPKAEREIQAIRDANLARRVKDSEALTAVIRKYANEHGLDFNRIFNEQVRRISTERAREIAMKTNRSVAFRNYEEVLLVLARSGSGQNAKDMNRIRALLTPAQNAEWKRIEDAVMRKALVVARGGNPFLVTGN